MGQSAEARPAVVASPETTKAALVWAFRGVKARADPRHAHLLFGVFEGNEKARGFIPEALAEGNMPSAASSDDLHLSLTSEDKRLHTRGACRGQHAFSGVL